MSAFTLALRIPGVLIAVCLLVGDAAAQPVESPLPQRFRSSVSIETNSAVIKRINDAREYIAGEKWALAVDILHGMLTSGEQVLVPLHPGLYVSTERRCNLLLSQLPEAGRAVYRRKADAQAKAWFDAAIKERNEAALRRVVRRAFASSYGDDALWSLGEWAWERGDIAAARRYWTQILPLPEGGSPEAAAAALGYPGTDRDIAAVEARCILCDLVSGEIPRAKAGLAALKRRAPQARGTIAGRTGRLVELLDALLRAARDWPFPEPSGDSTTFGVNIRRNGHPLPPRDVGAIRWTRKLAWQSLPVPDDDSGPKLRRHPACYPVCVDGVIYASIADRIFAYDARSGEPAFAVGNDRTTPVESRAVVFPEVAGKPSPGPIRDTVGVPRFTVTVHGGMLYARLGSPITGRLPNEVRAARSELICYRLGTDTGRLEWKVTADRFDRGWEFEGSPLVEKGRLYVAMRRRFPDTQLYVVCLDSRSGKEIWKRWVCTPLATFGNQQNHVTHHLLSVADETVFYSTNIGAIAALDAIDGSIRWLSTYETREPDRLPDLSNPMKAGFTPCLLAQGMLIAAPTDSNQILGIDPRTGLTRWRRVLRGGVRHLLGAQAGRLIVSGNRLWALDPHTGTVVWNRGYEDPAGFGYGRGLLAGEFVYWPLREEILVVRQSDGAIVRRIALRAIHGARGGNLLVARGQLVVAEADRLVVYGVSGIGPKSHTPAKKTIPGTAGKSRRR